MPSNDEDSRDGEEKVAAGAGSGAMPGPEVEVIEKAWATIRVLTSATSNRTLGLFVEGLVTAIKAGGIK